MIRRYAWDLTRQQIVVNVQVTKDGTVGIVAGDGAGQSVLVKVQDFRRGNIKDAARKSSSELVLGKVDKLELRKGVKGVANGAGKGVVVDAKEF